MITGKTGKFVKFLLFTLLYSLFTYCVYHWVGGAWASALYAVGFFSFYAAYFDSVGRPRWWAVYFAAYLAAALGMDAGLARAVFLLLIAVVLFGPLLYGRDLRGRIASMLFFWAGLVVSAVVVNAVGHLYRLAVPPAYPELPQALPSPFDIPVYMLGFYVLWRVHSISSRRGGAIPPPSPQNAERQPGETCPQRAAGMKGSIR